MRTSNTVAGAAVLLMSAAGGAADWTLDAANSTLEFVADYSGSELPGSFRRFAVDLDFDPQAAADGRLRVAVDMLSADMGDDDMNGAVTGDAWFDAEAFMKANFTSDDISSSGSGGFAANGMLELKGVGQAVTVPFEWVADGDQAAMRGTLVLRRLDFGIGTGTWTATDEVADDVTVVFDLLLRKRE